MLKPKTRLTLVQKRYQRGFLQCLLFSCASVVLFYNNTVEADSFKGYSPTYNTTYQKYLAKAQAGDLKAQNFIGYMRFYGEGVKQDYQQAHYWFHLAAEQGHLKAQRNLGLFHARALARIPLQYFDAEESNLWLTKASSNTPHADVNENLNKLSNNLEYFQSGPSFENGRKIYRSFCAGCHGIDGNASFKLSPSFAKAERLEKQDTALLASINDGLNIMPAWQDVLSQDLQKSVLFYIRMAFNAEQVSQQALMLSKEANKEVSKQLSLGAKTYERFCAGCHGFSGVAYYVNSPSFALGQRMNKSNSALLKSIRYGINLMPGWLDKLTHQEIMALVEYIRTLATEFDVGIDRELNKPTSRYYIFTPAGTN